MSKLLDNVLNKVSESNNEYRIELRSLNNLIDEKTTAIVGDIVTLSNYTIDFSNAISSAKEKLVNPILRVIENYVIKDLRGVESVNEQFVEKINDKIESANITSKEDSDKFISNLNVLLNDKYLQIVKIKRTNFLNENGSNDEIDQIVNDFVNYLRNDKNFKSERLFNIFEDFKSEIYKLIDDSLSKISNLYLNNFVSEVNGALNSAVDYVDIKGDDLYPNENSVNSLIPDMNPIPEIDIQLEKQGKDDMIQMDDYNELISNIPNVPDIPSVPEIPTIPDIPEITEMPYVANTEVLEEVKPMDIKPIAPIEIAQEVPKKENITKHSYDVEEILKIAKSPVVTMPANEDAPNRSFVNVVPLGKDEEIGGLDDDFNEREVVEEMIKRLTKRLEAIDERQAKLDDETQRLEADESFVNDLINNSNDKKQELDEFENSLNEKEKELDSKKEELDKKIKNVLPFANAVLNSEEESK